MIAGFQPSTVRLPILRGSNKQQKWREFLEAEGIGKTKGMQIGDLQPTFINRPLLLSTMDIVVVFADLRFETPMFLVHIFFKA